MLWNEELCVLWSAQLCTPMVGSLRLWDTKQCKVMALDVVDAYLVGHVVVKPNAVELDVTKHDAINSFYKGVCVAGDMRSSPIPKFRRLLDPPAQS